jgi:hypothetical protein
VPYTQASAEAPAFEPEPVAVPEKRTGLIAGLIAAALVVLFGGVAAAWFLLRPKPAPPAPAAAPPATATASPVVASASVTVTPEPASEVAAAADAEAMDAQIEVQPVPDAATASDLARVLFKCKPSCDRIVCDDEPLENTEAELELPPGQHTCVAEKEGYVPARRSFSLKAGRESVESFELAPKPKPKGTKAPRPRQKPCGTFINPCR